MTIVAWYGLVQDSPTRWTGQVGPYRTRPRTPESSWPAQVGAAAASTSAARASRAPRIVRDMRHMATVCCSPALVTPATSDISAPDPSRDLPVGPQNEAVIATTTKIT